MEEGEVVLITQRRQTRDGTDVDDSTDRDGYALRGNKLSPPGLRRNRTSRSCSTARTRRRERYVHFIDDKRGGVIVTAGQPSRDERGSHDLLYMFKTLRSPGNSLSSPAPPL